MLPEQFAEQLQGMGRVEQAALAAGARRALERMKEVSPANMSEGANSVYRELLQGGPHGDTAQKLNMLLGPLAAEQLIAAAQRETGFRSVYDQVASNSRTAVRGALQADMQTPGTPDMTVTGIVNKVPMLPVQAVTRSILESGTDKTRQSIADLLTRSGAERDATMDALLDLANKRAARSAAAPGQADTLMGALQGAQTGESENLPPILRQKAKSLAKILLGK